MGSTTIEIRGLSVSYDRKRVLTNIHLSVESGSVHGVVGPNGAGKSTLFKSILGLTTVRSGEITILGKPIEAVRSRISYVPQKDDIDWAFPATVKDVVKMGRYPYKRLFQRLDKQDDEKTMAAMEQLEITHLKDRQIGELSGGQQQRVFLARSLCQDPEIYLLDEPFVGIDATTEEKIIKILRDLAGRGKTLMVVHHDLSSVREYFDQVILLNQRLIAHGPTADVFNEQNIAKTYQAQLPILHDTGLLD
jgi:ABC-type Mn2+/Zn2+ transport system ATPase subunit